MGRLTWLLAGLAACAPSAPDIDHDGFAADQDCDDANALVYPGAPDTPGDGVDGDCDGQDAQHDFVGEWELVFLSAMFSSFQLVDSGSESGVLTLTEDLDAELDVSLGIDPAVVGYELDIALVMDGWVSPLDGEGRSWMRVEGEAVGETSFVELECTSSEDALDCEGVLLALGVNLDTVARFERR